MQSVDDTISDTRRVRDRWPALGALVTLVACGGDPSTGPGRGTRPDPELAIICRINSVALFDGGAGRGGIPALVNPPLVLLSDPAARYMEEYATFAATDDGSVEPRVIGLLIDGTPIAVPHNILWWHEIVNLDIGARRVAVTYCPLTGSSLAFDVTAGRLGRLGVSGLIFENNLVMFDVMTESLWPQLCLTALQGPLAGSDLIQVPAADMRWDEWKARFPNSRIVSSQTGFERNYARYPLRFYESSDFLLFPLSQRVDQRRAIKERVFGIGDGAAGIAFPFEELAATSAERLVVFTRIRTEEIIVLWNGRARAAAAFFPRTTDGTPVTLRASQEGFTDEGTGSRWGIEGQAIEGPLVGSTLAWVPDSYVAYWFAWATFHPRTTIWTRE